MKQVLDISRRSIVVLLVIAVILQSLVLYYNPLFQTQQTESLDPARIYAKSNRSVVSVRGVAETPTVRSVRATGFVILHGNSHYVITNFHVVDDVVNSTVTFSNGNSYLAEIIGSDAYSDLAILSVRCPSMEFIPLKLGSSSSLKVGASVVVIGNPLGLSSSITVGVVSQVGRTLPSQTSGGFLIADIIQFSAAINPGNSGGPLINAEGMVVGVTSAAISGSQGLGFAIPSDTITRELPFLAKNGKYERHPYLGVQLVDMNYPLAQAMRTNITWGLLIQSIVPDGPANRSGLIGGTQRVTTEGHRYLIGGDIIISIDRNRVIDFDALSTYLARNVVPGQTIQVEIVRSDQRMVISVEADARPPAK